MGKFAGMQIITRELREDAAGGADEVVARKMHDEAIRQGYHPLGAARLTWHEITQADYDLESLILLPYDCPPAFCVGDWRVRAVIEVREDTEISPQVR